MDFENAATSAAGRGRRGRGRRRRRRRRTTRLRAGEVSIIALGCTFSSVAAGRSSVAGGGRLASGRAPARCGGWPAAANALCQREHEREKERERGREEGRGGRGGEERRGEERAGGWGAQGWVGGWVDRSREAGPARACGRRSRPHRRERRGRRNSCPDPHRAILAPSDPPGRGNRDPRPSRSRPRRTTQRQRPDGHGGSRCILTELHIVGVPRVIALDSITP